MDCEIFISICTIKDILKSNIHPAFWEINFLSQKITFSIIKLTWFYHLITFLHSTVWKYNSNSRFPFHRKAKDKKYVVKTLLLDINVSDTFPILIYYQTYSYCWIYFKYVWLRNKCKLLYTLLYMLFMCNVC